MSEDRKKMEWTDQRVKDFWDYEAKHRPESYFAAQVGGYVIEDLAKYFPDAKNALDWGCGPGFMIEYLLRKNLETYGLDFSPESVAQVNRKYDKSEKFKGAYFLDEIRNKKINLDLILLVEVFEHLNDQYLSETLKNVQELLSDDGICIVTTPNTENLEKSMVFCPNCKSEFHRVQHVRIWTKESLLDHISKAGFEVVDAFSTNFNDRPKLYRKMTIGERVGMFIDHKLLRNKNDKITAKSGLMALPHLVCVFKKK